MRNRSHIFRAFRAPALTLLASTCLAQDTSSSRYLISEADIARELSAAGISANPLQIHLPVHMSAAVESPKLEIVTAKPISDHQVSLELRCPTAAECLPFFATVEAKSADVLLGEIQGKRHTATTTSPKVTSVSGVEPLTQTKLRVGSRATLTMRDGQMDIRLQVLAIDSGAVGQQVRVCTLDRKKIFHATVTGEGSVSGEME